jgi:putative transcriptional regulator
MRGKIGDHACRFCPINLTHHFLIAMPGLEDESFAKSVVYLCEHSERGALGLVINKPSDINLKNLFDKVDLPLRRDDLSGRPVFPGRPGADRARLCAA